MNNVPLKAESSTPLLAQETLAWAQSIGRGSDIVLGVRKTVRRRRRRALVGGVAALGCVVLGIGYFLRSPAAVVPLPGSAMVSVAARQTLPDGSIVELKDGARIDSQMSGNGVRKVFLLSGGAHFAVAKNPDRPFVVAAGTVEVRAVGTAFAVDLHADKVAVVVTEGTVAVEKPGRPESDASAARAGGILLTVSQKAEISLTEPTVRDFIPAKMPLSPVEMSQELAWRVPRMRFADTSLSEAVAVFNKYSGTKLVLAPDLGGLRIGGVVRADNTESFLRLLKDEFGIVAIQSGPTIELRRGDAR